MKRFFAFFTALVLVIACILSVGILNNNSSTASATTYNAEVVTPELDNYIYLKSPSLISAYNGGVAVYDDQQNKVILSGGAVPFDCPTLTETEYFVKLATANGTLYALTSLSRLYDFETASFADDMDTHASTQMVTGGDGKLYLYNGLNNLYRYDGTSYTTLTDRTMLTFNSEAFAVTAENIAYFINDGALYIVNYTADTTTKISNTSATALFSNSGYAYALDDTDIKLYSGTENTDTYNIAETFENSQDIIQLDGGTGYFIALYDTNVVTSFSCNATDGAITIFSRYGCSGTAAGWYNNPTDIQYLSNDSFIIWDKGNNRFVYVNDATSFNCNLSYSSAIDFDYFSANTSMVFLAKGADIYYAPLDTVSKTLSLTKLETGYDIGAFTTQGNYVYLYDKLSKNIYFADYTADEIKFKLFCVSVRALTKLIATDGDTPVLYGLSDEKLSIFTTMGISGISIDITSVTDFAVDYSGNIFILKTTEGVTTITKYQRTENAFTEDTTITIVGNNFEFETLSSITLADNGTDGTVLAVDSTKNLFVSISSLPYNDSSFVNSGSVDLTAISPEEVSYAKSSGAIVYSYLNNYNIVTDIANSGEILAVLDDLSTNEILCVLAANGKVGYVRKSDTTALTATEITDSAVRSLHESLNLYNAPTTDTTNIISFDKNKIFTVIDNCANYTSGSLWYYVCYLDGNDMKYGYVLRTRVMTATIVPEIETANYVKAKAERVGAKVNIYATQDTESTLLISVTDGARLKLLETFNENSTFTFVEYDGVSGYVLTSQIQVDTRLTSGQIAAIVLACITLLITAVYFLIFRRNKKLSAK